MWIETLINWDKWLSLKINAAHSGFWDGVMVFISDMWSWIPLYVLFLVLIVWKYRKTSWIIIVGIILLIALVDSGSVHLFKNVFHRLRPCHDPSLEGLLNLPNGCGGMYGFISSHAANHFAIAAYLTPFLSYWKVFSKGGLYIWAAVIAYSRIYLAAHFLGDVVVGALFGSLLGYGLFQLSRLAFSRYYPSTLEYPFRLKRR